MSNWANIVKRHPTIDFGGYKESVGCPEEWHSLLDSLCTELEEEAQKQNAVVIVLQIKEKWGGLRFYTDIVPKPWHAAEIDTKSLYDIIAKYEELSYILK